MTTTVNGVATTTTDTSLDESGAIDAFLNNWDVEPEPSRDEESETRRRKPAPKTEDAPAETEETTEEPEETPGTEAEPEATEDEKPKAKKYVEDDNETYVKVKVGEDEHEVPVSQLKRLFGQESALTQKSQQTAEVRKQADAEVAKATATLGALLEQAKKEFEPYQNLNLFALSKDPSVSAEELKAITEAAQQAHGKVQFLQTELGGYMQAIQQSQQAQLRERAQAAHKVLSDPEKGIQGWSQKTYDDIRAHAIDQGVDAGLVNGIVDAGIIKLMHKAMMFDRGSQKTATTKVNKTPKKVVKTSSSPERSTTPNAGKKAEAMKVMKSRSTDDNVAAAFMAGWERTQD